MVRRFDGKRFSVHQLRPGYQTGTQVLTGFQDRVALMAEVVACIELSRGAGLARKSVWDASDWWCGSSIPSRRQQIPDVQLSAMGMDVKRRSVGHDAGARGESAEA